MSQATLYNKYRPRRFADVAQPVVARILKAQVALDKIADANLFIGPPGTGKTTLARVTSMALNCETRADGDVEPCGTCRSCQQILAGQNRDVIEINCALTGGKGDVVDQVISKLRLQPTGRYRIFILDEAHLLTSQAQNALLKVFEEPDPHLRYFLCTTDQGKMIPATHSRFQTFQLSPVSDTDQLAILQKVVKEESIPAEDEALATIVQHAEGCAREALKVLQQVAAIGVTDENVCAVLGRAPRAMSIALVRCIQQVKRGDARLLLEAAQAEGRNLAALLEDAARVVDRMIRMKVLRQPDNNPEIAALANDFGNGSHLLGVSDGIFETIKNIRQNVPPDLAIQVGIQQTIDRFALLLAKSKAAPKAPEATN